MADQDVDSRIQALEEQIAQLRGNAFRPISPFTAKNPMFFRGNLQIDHTKMRNRNRQIWFPVGSATATVGTPVFGAQGSNLIYQAWAFDAAAIETIVLATQVPADIINWTVATVGPITWRLYWTNLGAGTGDVVWQIGGAFRATGINLNSNALTAETAQIISAPAQNVLKTSSFTSSITPALPLNSDQIVVTVSRTGNDGSDTLGNDAGLVGITMNYVADM